MEAAIDPVPVPVPVVVPVLVTVAVLVLVGVTVTVEPVVDGIPATVLTVLGGVRTGIGCVIASTG